ncbi:uncharacterized protein SAPINGB_P006066 [Magnusiomyces paraingens]|uniref:Uncharacterized protein n=1 Tax=Magnusiomyces paraingens TaxID=2606893 RepID=A0A5E8C886_9ASCO|nr:uncharacterized protein SAPINGB_P006066 [Saprochaete ingens]VVT58158.1 unnamed protein product [Saprochaete ingens]
MSENSRGEISKDISVSILSALNASKKGKSSSKKILSLQKQVQGLKNVVEGLLSLLKSQAEETVFFLSSDLGKNGPPSKDIIHLLSSNYQVKQKVSILLTELKSSQMEEAEDDDKDDDEDDDIKGIRSSVIQDINEKAAETKLQEKVASVLAAGLNGSTESSFTAPSDTTVRFQSSPKINRAAIPQQEHPIVPQSPITPQPPMVSLPSENSQTSFVFQQPNSRIANPQVVANPSPVSQSASSQLDEHPQASSTPQHSIVNSSPAVTDSPVVSKPPLSSTPIELYQSLPNSQSPLIVQSPVVSQVNSVDVPAPAETHVRTQPKPQPVPKTSPISRNWIRPSQIKTRSQAHALAQAQAKVQTEVNTQTQTQVQVSENEQTEGVSESSNEKIPVEPDADAVLEVPSTSESPKNNEPPELQIKPLDSTKAHSQTPVSTAPHRSQIQSSSRLLSTASASASSTVSPPALSPGPSRTTRNSTKVREFSAKLAQSQDQVGTSQDIMPAPAEFIVVNSSTSQSISNGTANQENLTPAPPINSSQESSRKTENGSSTSKQQQPSSSVTLQHDLPLPVTQSRLIKNSISFSPANAANLKPTQNDTIKKLMMRREASLFADILPPPTFTSSSSSSKPKSLTISLRTTRASERKQESKANDSSLEIIDNEDSAFQNADPPIKKDNDMPASGSKRTLEEVSVEDGTDSDITITSVDSTISTRLKRPRKSHVPNTGADLKNTEDNSVLPDSAPIMDPECRYYRLPSDEYTTYNQLGNKQFRNGYLRNHYGNIILFQELGQIALKKKLLIGVGNQKLSPYKNDTGNNKLNSLLNNLMLLRTYLQNCIRTATEVANKKIEEIQKNHGNLSDSNMKIICSQEIPMLELMQIDTKKLNIDGELLSEGLYRVMRTRAHDIEYCVCNRVIGYCTSLCPCYKSLGGCRAPQCESIDSPNDFCPSNRRHPLYK